VRFRSVVEKAEWDETTATWVVSIADAEGKTYMMRSKFLVSAVGGLSIPKKCDIPGAENFNGVLFHSAQWDHTVDLKGKDVVTIGKSFFSFSPITHVD
jgi:cation diffusion facilitator CzcD-associated flavoprotein CzcO